MNFAVCSFNNCKTKTPDNYIYCENSERNFTVDYDYCFCKDCFKLLQEKNKFPENREMFIKATNNGDDCEVKCGNCSHQFSRKYLVVCNNALPCCESCCLTNPDLLINNSNSLKGDDSVYIKEIRKCFANFFESTDLIKNIKINLIYCSNIVEEKIKKHGSVDTTRNNNQRKLIICLFFEEGIREIILASAKIIITDSEYHSEVTPCNRQTLYLSLFDSNKFPTSFTHDQKNFILSRFILSVVIASVNLISIRLFHFLALSPRVFNDYLFWGAMASRANGHPLINGNQETLLNFYIQNIVNPLVEMKLVDKPINMLTLMLRLI
jgi:hypothetical protein